MSRIVGAGVSLAKELAARKLSTPRTAPEGDALLSDLKSVMPRDERGRWVRLPRTPARHI